MYRQTGIDVATLAGGGPRGLTDGAGVAARFASPLCTRLDWDGGFIVADSENHCIRRVNADGHVTTVAGCGETGYRDGRGREAAFCSPAGVAVQGIGEIIVADTDNHCIRRISADGIVSTVAGGSRRGYQDGNVSEALFSGPTGVSAGRNGEIYVADNLNHRIRVISPEGRVTTLAGNGEGAFADGFGIEASFHYPQDVIVDNDGNLIVSDSENHCIRKISPTGMVTTLAGSGRWSFSDGPGHMATFWSPSGLALDGDNNVIVADYGFDCIRKVTPEGMVSTLDLNVEDAPYLSGWGMMSPGLNCPEGVAVDGMGNIIVADSCNNRLCLIPLAAAPLIPEDGEATLATDFAKLLEEPVFADVTFIVGTERVRAHRNVLTARSNYFSAMLNSHFREGTSNAEIVVEDASVEAFKALMTYLYTGKIVVKDEAVVLGLALLAHRYDLNSAYTSCVRRLRRTLDAQNAIRLFIAADGFLLESLRTMVRNYIKAHFRQIQAKAPQSLQELSQHPDLSYEILMLI